jgi:cytidine deaminase
MLKAGQVETLIEAATRARANAYAPYSGFQVGAALMDADGEVHVGANVENASYGLCTCAERSAVAAAVSGGKRDFRAIAVVGPEGSEPCPPCGSCRQILYEFAPDMLVVTTGGGEAQSRPLRELLPDAFGPDALGGAGGGRGDG